ncbi:MAG: hypothetical protein A2Y90_03395 [Chloroflexi bacterium RBG_13_52_12]|nr:MAG: hypothetical protein A2Y90_03395 [Chloroflexi bacterium RBG_13_52_12]
MKTLVLGLGNPILCDDGIGLRVVEELEVRLRPQEATITADSLAGLDILDMLVGYDRVIIIDSIRAGGVAGWIYRLELDALLATRHATSVHDVNLATAVELGRRLGLDLPQKFDIFAIEVENTTSFREECTPAVAKAIPICVEMVLQTLRKDDNK